LIKNLIRKVIPGLAISLIRTRQRRYLLAMMIALSGVPISSVTWADWRATNQNMIHKGVQAVLMCNGLFTSHRSLTQVFDQELAYLAPPRFEPPLGHAGAGPYSINHQLKSVTIGTNAPATSVSAVFSEGFGCIVLPPGTLPTIKVKNNLPLHPMADKPLEASHRPWPEGDLVTPSIPDAVDRDALARAANWSFQRPSAEQVTISLLVVYKGQIILEQYAEGFDQTTRTRTWSTAKSIAVTLLGMLVDAGELALDSPLAIDWLPEIAAPELDPRNKISLRHVLNMSSGLDPVDSLGQEYISGSGLAYWAGDSTVEGARRRGLVRQPGGYWDYENYDTLLAVYAIRKLLGSDESYWSFPRQRLLDPLGMASTLLSVDRFGDFVLSSQVYTNARDLARFGLLYLNSGVWSGQRLISEAWIEFVRTPAPAATNRDGRYGGHWWLVPTSRTDVPKDAYATAGNRGQYVIVVPSKDLVIVRRGLDYGRQGFDQWDLLREVLKAFL
jgi:CubicO group peptidase (beta-lactamase class C family)